MAALGQGWMGEMDGVMEPQSSLSDTLCQGVRKGIWHGVAISAKTSCLV